MSSFNEGNQALNSVTRSLGYFNDHPKSITVPELKSVVPNPYPNIKIVKNKRYPDKILSLSKTPVFLDEPEQKPQPKKNLSHLSVSELAQQFDAACFFDNDFKKIKEVQTSCGNLIECFLINETPTNDLKSTPLTELPFYNPEDSSYEFIQLLLSTGNTHDVYDKLSGIDESTLSQALLWFNKTKKLKKRAMIFDWDQTLTVFNSFWNITLPNYESYLSYLMGGDERLRLIQTNLKEFSNEGIHIIILTNNTACGQNDIFLKVVDTLLKGTNYSVICSSYTAQGNKGRAITQDSRFKGCNPTKGGKRRKTRGKKKQRSTRKHSS